MVFCPPGPPCAPWRPPSVSLLPLPPLNVAGGGGGRNSGAPPLRVYDVEPPRSSRGIRSEVAHK